jgi:hypothetical protein
MPRRVRVFVVGALGFLLVLLLLAGIALSLRHADSPQPVLSGNAHTSDRPRSGTTGTGVSMREPEEQHTALVGTRTPDGKIIFEHVAGQTAAREKVLINSNPPPADRKGAEK